MATVIHDDLWFCTDCTLAFAGADETIVDQDRAAAVEAGQIGLCGKGHVVSDDQDLGVGHLTFSRLPCDCCGTHLAGDRTRHAILSA